MGGAPSLGWLLLWSLDMGLSSHWTLSLEQGCDVSSSWLMCSGGLPGGGEAGLGCLGGYEK